jgi:hypothetical protein
MAGAGTRQDRTSISSDQAAIRLREGAVSWLGQEHCALMLLFALSNLWMARRHLLVNAVEARL